MGRVLIVCTGCCVEKYSWTGQREIEARDCRAGCCTVKAVRW